MNVGRDTDQPYWRRQLAWKSFGSLGPAAICAVAWAMGFAMPWWVVLPAAVASVLFAACWWIGPLRREGIWQLANFFDTMAQVAVALMVMGNLAGAWRIPLMLACGCYALAAVVELSKAWRAFQPTPE